MNGLTSNGGEGVDKLIQDRDAELNAMAQRIIVMQLENPEGSINGMLHVIRSRININILELSEWAGENGRLWEK
jgi:hypothetical protein